MLQCSSQFSLCTIYSSPGWVFFWIFCGLFSIEKWEIHSSISLFFGLSCLAIFSQYKYPYLPPKLDWVMGCYHHLCCGFTCSVCVCCTVSAGVPPLPASLPPRGFSSSPQQGSLPPAAYSHPHPTHHVASLPREWGHDPNSYFNQSKTIYIRLAQQTSIFRDSWVNKLHDHCLVHSKVNE